ncbi:MAG: porin family protein [Flavobacterium sp.]|nr:porin family protein [Flavobacterium sp.]
MRKIYLFLLLISFVSYSQQKKDWFFGLEIGNNTITSSNLSNKNSLQGGFVAEYYFAKHWIATARLKYFETGVTTKSETEYFEGAVISIPLNLKWEYKITNKFKGNLFTGIALNKEVKSNFYYPVNEKIDYSTFFGSFNAGVGLTYFLNSKTAIFINPAPQSLLSVL